MRVSGYPVRPGPGLFGDVSPHTGPVGPGTGVFVGAGRMDGLRDRYRCPGLPRGVRGGTSGPY